MCMDFTYGKDELVRKGLNEDQIAAITDFSSDLLVLSTAGSGKTRVITEKIAYALGVLRYSPDSILAITFTNKAVDEMRNRVRTLCGERFDLSNLTISTFHSFGRSMIRSYLRGEFESKNDHEKISIIQGLFNIGRKEAENIGSLIERAKNNDIFPSDSKEVEAMAAENDCPDFPRYYAEYENEFRNHNYLDFEDMIIKANGILATNSKARAYYNNRYKLILVDEYQDTNRMQDSFLKKVKGPDCQLVVVGDDDQGIYGFRGAEVKNIRSYHENRNVRTINLGCNYRSTSAILNFATAVIERSGERISKRIFTINEKGEKPLVLNAFNRDEEIRKIIEIIKEDPDMDTAILARTNGLARSFLYPLLHENLPVDIMDGGMDLLKNRVILKTFYILSFMEDPTDVEMFADSLPLREDILSDDDIETIELTDFSDYIDAMEKALKGDFLSETGRAWVAHFLEFYKRAVKMKDERVSPAFENAMIHLILGEEGFSKKKKSGDRIREFLQLKNTCFVSSGSTLLRDFLNVFKKSKKDGVVDDGENSNKIKLLTIHKAKGLEFDRVFVVGANDDVIPSEKADSPEELEEERRLFYVALTRAKKRLYVSYCDQDSKGNECVPSRFLWDVDPSLYDGTVDGVEDFIPFIPAEEDILTDKVASPILEKPQMMDVFKCGDTVITPKGYRAVITHIDDKLHLRLLDSGINITYDAEKAFKELTFYKEEEE